jgi:tRNA pseudouridine55 synthase
MLNPQSSPPAPQPLNHHGLLLVDKPKGWTSHDVVGFVRRRLKISSVGHCGTLDPAARGLLVLLLGEATKLSQYLLEKNKAYHLKFKLGLVTDSGDMDGQVLSQVAVDLDTEKIRAAILNLMGEMELPVPKFSAIKVNGQKLYEKARRGEDFTPPMKKMAFFDPQILDVQADSGEVILKCMKGSYVRSWVTTLGENLGCGATLTDLCRTESVPFQISQALTLEQVEACRDNGEWTRGFIPVAEALTDWKSIQVLEQPGLLMNGQIPHELRTQLLRSFKPGVDVGVKALSPDGQLLALIGFEQGQGFVLRRVFRY